MKRKKLGIVFLTVCVIFLSGCANAMKEGTEHLEQKEYSEAVKSFEEVIKDGKNVGEAYHGQGIAYWELKEYEKAKDALEKALENGVEGTPNIYQTWEMHVCNWKNMTKHFLVTGKEWPAKV